METMTKQEAKARVYDLLALIEQAKLEIQKLNEIISQPEKKKEVKKDNKKNDTNK